MKIKKQLTTLIIAVLAIFFIAKNSYATIAQWQFSNYNSAKTKARILSSFYDDESKQKKLILGVHFQIEDGWHIYGNESQGIGIPPMVNFKGSTNYLSHKIYWPKAIIKEEKIGKEVLKYSLYEGEIILPIEVDLQDVDNKTALMITLDYGLCKDVCIPVSNNFTFEVEPKQDFQSLNLIQKFFEKKIIIDEKNNEILNQDFEQKNATAEINSAKNLVENSSPKTLTIAVFAAILGGLILNIMPCVLPVLGIKLMSVINHQNSQISRIRFAFISSTLGIIFCFVIFAIFAIIIKTTGNIFGWGLQFQNPYFLIFLIIVLLAFIANMLGFFEITFDQFLANFINKKIAQEEQKKNIFLPNFLSGVLAVLLATPCSAPFLGSAISFALTQNNSTIFLIFIAMALGLAMPYAILIISPKLIYLLPKSGNWMFNFKKLLALFLATTVLWLIYVLSQSVGVVGGAIACISSLLFFKCFKIKIKFLQIFSFLFLTITLISLPESFKGEKSPKMAADAIWHNFNEQEIYDNIAKGKVVVIDITANWCITCKFNKINVLHDQEVVKKLKDENVFAMRGDITKPNAEILAFIHKKGRYAIPFNAVYGPNAKEGLLASELLSKKELLELIKKAQ